MRILSIEHKHANVYLIGEQQYVMYDCGWQDSFSVIRSALKAYDIQFEQVRGVLVSHFHPDHGGSLELLRQHGIKPLVMEQQLAHIDWLNGFFQQKKNDPNGDYVPFDTAGCVPLSLGAANVMLAEWGIDGQVLYTPGHSADSISLVVGDAAFVGDLPAFEVAEGYGESVVACWLDLLACDIRLVYPAHGPCYEIG
ncbi:MAG: MBL fold metallo-hydrolase [Coriobacteriia bacterium]|nr:MBL fold metallo-hydrolase [Coriobacteriia bacterium]